MGEDKWRHDGVQVIPNQKLDGNVPSTPGMDRKAAINFARTGAKKLWAGTVTIEANAKTGAHHHGHLESVIYVVKGKARMRWGEQLEFCAEAGPGDFIYVPPYVPHQEINASKDEVLECVLCRSDGEAIAVNIDIQPIETPDEVLWIDPTHPKAVYDSGYLTTYRLLSRFLTKITYSGRHSGLQTSNQPLVFVSKATNTRITTWWLFVRSIA